MLRTFRNIKELNNYGPQHYIYDITCIHRRIEYQLFFKNIFVGDFKGPIDMQLGDIAPYLIHYGISVEKLKKHWNSLTLKKKM